ncbi:MAG: amidase, partial [Rhodospirillales bacterium]|nr:amidase [Rhodospirillales bacterium]
MAEFKEYDTYDAIGLAELVKRKQVSPTDLVDTAIARAERLNPKLNAIVHPAHDQARAAIARGLPDGPFTGVPFLLKDLGCEAVGYATHSGSRFFADYQWTVDSEIWIRLRRAGLVAFARTTSPELGISPATEAKVYGG